MRSQDGGHRSGKIELLSGPPRAQRLIGGQHGRLMLSRPIAAFALLAVVVMVFALVAGCADKAGPALKRCQQLTAENKPEEALEECIQAVSADHASKSGQAAAALIGDLRKAVAQRKADAERHQAALRKRLLDSDDPNDWRTLVKEHPDTPESKDAETKLRQLVSICANRASWDLTRAIQRLGERPGQAALLDGMSPEFAAAAAEGGAERCEKEAKELDETASEIANHDLQPGEESVRQIMVANHKRIAEQSRKWARAFKSYNGDLAPFAALQAASERVAGQVLEKDTEAFNICLKLPATDSLNGATAKTSADEVPTVDPARTPGYVSVSVLGLGVSVDVPAAILNGNKTEPGLVVSGDGSVSLRFDRLAPDVALSAAVSEAAQRGRSVVLKRAEAGGFVLSGIDGTSVYYDKAIPTPHGLVRFSFVYPVRRKAEIDPEVGRIAKTFGPLGRNPSERAQ